jgi:hypothetical protein
LTGHRAGAVLMRLPGRWGMNVVPEARRQAKHRIWSQK